MLVSVMKICEAYICSQLNYLKIIYKIQAAVIGPNRGLISTHILYGNTLRLSK